MVTREAIDACVSTALRRRVDGGMEDHEMSQGHVVTAGDSLLHHVCPVDETHRRMIEVRLPNERQERFLNSGPHRSLAVRSGFSTLVETHPLNLN